MNDFTQLADLASERLGGRVIQANDEFFAPKENLLKESKPVFIEGKYTARGKWMDGWETRRRRTPGHDWCIIRLGLPGVIRGVLVDTSFFRGNYPEQFSLEACDLGGRPPHKNEKKLSRFAEAQWVSVLAQTPLKGDSHNLFPVNCDGRITHLRFRIYPDGGVARLRLYGEASPDAGMMSRAQIDLVAVENGGSVVTSSDQFFGEPRNLLLPGRARNMGDGWETRRRRGPGHDWVILKLGLPGLIQRVEVDTSHFKGNFPESCSLEACHAPGVQIDAAAVAAQPWRELLPRTKLTANRRHIFNGLNALGPATHLRFNIFPDGGVARLRVFGRVERAGISPSGIARFNRLSKVEARKALIDCCGAKSWVTQMTERMPYSSAGELLETATSVWTGLRPEEWLEAFQHHPQIGEKQAKAKQSAKAREWSTGEQSAAEKSSAGTLAALAAANREYAAKFGHIFLISATGKTSEEILNHLRQRLSNDPGTELGIAAEEQIKITRLRLEKLLAS
jgi:allantoicase